MAVQVQKKRRESLFYKVEANSTTNPKFEIPLLLPLKCVPFSPFVMHSSLEPEKMEEESQQQGGGGSNSLKRKFSEIDGDQNLDSVSSPMMIDSNGYLHFPLLVLDLGSYGSSFVFLSRVLV